MALGVQYLGNVADGTLGIAAESSQAQGARGGDSVGLALVQILQCVQSHGLALLEIECQAAQGTTAADTFCAVLRGFGYTGGLAKQLARFLIDTAAAP